MSPTEPSLPTDPRQQLERAHALLIQSEETIRQIREALKQTESMLQRLSQEQPSTKRDA